MRNAPQKENAGMDLTRRTHSRESGRCWCRQVRQAGKSAEKTQETQSRTQTPESPGERKSGGAPRTVLEI